MDFTAYYRSNPTYLERDDPRLTRIVDLVGATGAANILDVGCGSGWSSRLLRERLACAVTGVDALENVPHLEGAYVCADLTWRFPFRDGSFDCVVAGEIIEHVPVPDLFLREVHRVLEPGGHLVVSTPNLVSWANRVLVPLGIQPLGTETSSEVALGRRLRVLGQGSQVQGHLKLFTHRSIVEILERHGFDLLRREGMTSEFPGPFARVDRFFARFAPLASDLVVLARARRKPAPPVPARPHHPRGRGHRSPG